MESQERINGDWVQRELSRMPSAAQSVTVPGETWAAVLELLDEHLPPFTEGVIVQHRDGVYRAPRLNHGHAA